MKCSKCKKSSIKDVEYAGKHYCEKHFLELMDKRIRKNLRTRRLINIKNEYFLMDDGSSEAKLTKYFLNEIFEGRLRLNTGKKNTHNLHEILPTNLDEQAGVFLYSFLKNKKSKADNSVRPLEVILQKEIKLLCKILKIPFKPRVKKDMFLEIEIRHPGTKFSLFQSKMNLEKINDLKN